MKYLTDRIWESIPCDDFRPRFFVESFIEKLSMNTPHFYQSRLMTLFSSCSEALAYIEEYQKNTRALSYLQGTLDEIDSCWEKDIVGRSLFTHLKKTKSKVFKEIRGKNPTKIQINRLSVFCKAIISRENQYHDLMLNKLNAALFSECDLSKKGGITKDIYSLTGLYTSHLLNKGYSPTYLYNRSNMFTRINNFHNRTFKQQFDKVTQKLKNNRLSHDIYFGIQTNKPSLLLNNQKSSEFSFFSAPSQVIKGNNLIKLKKNINISLTSKISLESTDYISASWLAKEKLDKFLDAVTALELHPKIKVSENCVVFFTSHEKLYSKAFNINLLISFLASESGTYFSNTYSSILNPLAMLNNSGKDHLGRSLRYLRLAREAISLEQKLLNLWISLESIFSDGESTVLTNILEYVPQIYALSGLNRRLNYLKDLLVKNNVTITPIIQEAILSEGGKFNSGNTTNEHIYAILNNKDAAIELFNSLGDREHLKFKLITIFEEFKSNKTISKRIKQTQVDVSRQLKRIYYLRNKIAHTGHYENISPQLVTHLLDYIAVSYLAISSSATSSNQTNKHSISDFMVSYKMGIEVVLDIISENDEVVALNFQSLTPKPVI